MILKSKNTENMIGKILVSTPYMDGGTCFSKSVICILIDDEQGTLGVIVNKVLSSLKPNFLFNALEIEDFNGEFNEPIHFGGPIESEKGLVIHTNDYNENTLITLKSGISLSSNVKILKDISNKKGPKKSLFALGYAGWSVGQLEEEIKNNSWIILPYSENLIFNNNNEEKWNIAINSIGFKPEYFSSTFGTA